MNLGELIGHDCIDESLSIEISLLFFLAKKSSSMATGSCLLLFRVLNFELFYTFWRQPGPGLAGCFIWGYSNPSVDTLHLVQSPNIAGECQPRRHRHRHRHPRRRQHQLCIEVCTQSVKYFGQPFGGRPRFFRLCLLCSVQFSSAQLCFLTSDLLHVPSALLCSVSFPMFFLFLQHIFRFSFFNLLAPASGFPRCWVFFLS